MIQFRFVFCVVLCAGLLVPSTGFSLLGIGKDKRPDAAPLVLAAFQGSCGSLGPFTQAAKAQTDAIINIFQTLQQTDACKPYAGQLTAIQSLATQMQGLQSSSTYATYLADQQNYQLLTLALQNAPANSPNIQNIENAIQSLQLQMYSDQAIYNATTQTSQHNLLVSQASSMINWGQQLATMSNSPSLSDCLKQSPTAAIELATNMAAFGGSFLPGTFGLASGSLAQLLTTGLEIFRQSQYSSAIFDARSVEMPDALNCALESMTESYCSADDSYSLLELARKNRLANYAASPLWRGIDILGRQLPALLQWLGKIQNEVPPQDSYQANKQNSVLQEIFQIQQQDLNSVALINNALSQAASATTDSAKLASIVNAIANVAIELASPAETVVGNSVSTTPTPFTTYQPDALQWACWLDQGPDVTNCPSETGFASSTGSTPTVSQITGYIEGPLGLTTAQLPALELALLNNWKLLLPKVRVLVNADFARIIATNAGTIIASAKVASSGFPLSPLQVLQNISEFLNDMNQYGGQNAQLPLALAQEKAKVDEAIRQVSAPDAIVCPNGPNSTSLNPPSSPTPVTPAQCQNQRLITVFNLFDLQNGTQVFLTDMDDLVNIDLQYRFTSGQIPPDQTKILAASGRDIDISLESAGSGDLGAIGDDLDSARSDIEENIQVFRHFFQPAFQQVVKQESNFLADEKISSAANRPHGQRLAQLCMFWLLTSDPATPKNPKALNWPDQTTQEICRNTVYFNENSSPDSGNDMTPAFELQKLETQVAPLPFIQRACIFHKYEIQNKADTLYTTAPSQ